MIKKSFYEAPEAELLLVKFERNILSQENNVNKAFISVPVPWGRVVVRHFLSLATSWRKSLLTRTSLNIMASILKPKKTSLATPILVPQSMWHQKSSQPPNRNQNRKTDCVMIVSCQ